MKLNPEQKAGAIFAAAAAGIVILIIIVLSAQASRGLRYNVVFGEGKGVQVGDRVRLNGIDIGEVDAVKLGGGGENVTVRLKIAPEHREKILAGSTAYIASNTFPNVSGQMVVEIHNGSEPSGVMKPGTMIQGKDSLLELKAWQLKGQVSKWSEAMSQASKDFGEGAEKLTEGARKALEEMAEGVKKSLQEGASEEATPPAVTDSPTTPTAAPTPDFRKMADQMADFMKDMGKSGGKKMDELAKQWDSLKKDLAPKLEEMKKNGGEFLDRQLRTLQEEIEKQMESLRRKDKQAPSERDNEPITI